MATQLKHTDFAYSPSGSTVRVAFQSCPALPAVAATIATLPSAIRSATLDDLNSGTARITAMAEALVAKAGEVLSPRMYRAFLRWGGAAIYSNTLCEDGDECERRTKAVAQAIRFIASIDAQHDKDGLFKAYLMALEVADAPGFGPLVGDAASTYSVDKLAIGFSTDLTWLSPLTAMIDELSTAAWTASCSTSAYSPAVGEAMMSVFRDAVDRPTPIKLDDYDPFMRGPLIQWQKAYARYEQAAWELDVFDREVHTPASDAWTATSEKLGDGSDPATVEAEAAASVALDLAQEQYDDLCSARYDALRQLLRVPAPGPAELAIKLRLFSSDYGWTGGDEQRAAGEKMAADARRFGRVGPFVEIDQDILNSFAAYRSELQKYASLPATVSSAEEQPYYVRMDEASLPLRLTSAATIEGVIARLRFALHSADHEPWMPDVVLNPQSERLKAGMPLADLSFRLIWQSIEDLARLGGVSLSAQTL